MAKTAAPAGGPGPLNPVALPTAQLVKVLAAAGGNVPEEAVREDLAAGAPANADGTIHLVHYTAWLASQVQ
jgi:hypothetical protein